MKIKKEYYEHYAPKCDNLDKIDQFLEKCKLPQFTPYKRDVTLRKFNS